MLERLKSQAEANGVDDLVWLDQTQIAAIEPSVLAVRGLLSPSTGIIDSHSYMSALRSDADPRGAHVVVPTPVVGGSVLATGFEARVRRCRTVQRNVSNGRERCRPACSRCGSLNQRDARSEHPGAAFRQRALFVLGGRAPFNRLVYPVPVPGGLGVHLTLDLSKQARFGPDVSWLGGVDYAFDERRAESFYAAIRAYYPALADGALVPGYTGIRPKLGAAGTPAQDFVIQGPRSHGIAGLVNLYGIESPGLTASLALAEATVAFLVEA